MAAAAVIQVGDDESLSGVVAVRMAGQILQNLEGEVCNCCNNSFYVENQEDVQPRRRGKIWLWVLG